MSQVSLESSDTDFERPIKRARFHHFKPSLEPDTSQDITSTISSPPVTVQSPPLDITSTSTVTLNQGQVESDSNSNSTIRPLPSVRRKSISCNLCGVDLVGGQGALNRHQRNNCPGVRESIDSEVQVCVEVINPSLQHFNNLADHHLDHPGH